MMRMGSDGEFEGFGVTFGKGLGSATDFWLERIAERPVLGTMPGMPALAIGRDYDVRAKSQGLWLAGQLALAENYRASIANSLGGLAKAGLAALRPVLNRRPTPAEAPIVAWHVVLGTPQAAPDAYVANMALDLPALYLGQGLQVPDCLDDCATPAAALKSAAGDRDTLAAMADLAARNEAAVNRMRTHAPYCPRRVGDGFVCECRYNPAYAYRH